MYLMVNSILKGRKAEDKQLQMPTSYGHALRLMDEYKEQLDAKSLEYYKTIYEHELMEFTSDYNKWEAKRIY